MIHGIVLLCIVPSTMALSPRCHTVPLSQYALLQCPTVPFSLSHDPIVRVSIVPASSTCAVALTEIQFSSSPFPEGTEVELQVREEELGRDIPLQTRQVGFGTSAARPFG